MYLEHFNFKDVPFSLTPNTEYYCSLPSHQEAFNTILLSLRTSEGFIKITGEVGTGKTLLCRKLLNALDDKEFVTAYLPHPDLTPSGLRKALAKELGIDFPSDIDRHSLLGLMTDTLLALHREGRKVILIVDEAQAVPRDTLETLRLLTNIETESKKLLHIVLLGQPEFDARLAEPEFRQLKQRIMFSYYLQPVARENLDAYLFHRLSTAGYNQEPLFSKKACDFLYTASRGLPRLINVLCHKSLMVTYGRGERVVDHMAMRDAIKDTDSAFTHTANTRAYLATSVAAGVLTVALLIAHYGGLSW